MIKLIGKRASLLLASLTLIGAAFVVFSPRAAAGDELIDYGGFDYRCDEWEQYCDNGSGDFGGGSWGGGGGGTSGGSGGVYSCPSPVGCGNFGCHTRSYADHTQVCNQYKIGDGPGTCQSIINCMYTPN
jgi:hypothetical protein